jgi:hypothetical protein
MASEDVLDRAEAVNGSAGRIVSGLFRDPLFDHKVKQTEQGVEVSSVPVLSWVGERKPSATVTLADQYEARAYVTAFDRALLRQGAKHGVSGIYAFKVDGESGQVILTDRKDSGVPGSLEYRIIDNTSTFQGRKIDHKVVQDQNGQIVSSEPNHFDVVGKLASRAAMDNLAHRAEVSVATISGVSALPLAEAKGVINRFNEREEQGSEISRIDYKDKSFRFGENEARYSFGSGRLDLMSDPGDPAGAHWSYKVARRVAGDPLKTEYVEKERGPLTMESLSDLMERQSRIYSAPKMVEAPRQPRSAELLKATFIADPKQIASAQPQKMELPPTGVAGAEAAGVAGDLSGWRKAKADDRPTPTARPAPGGPGGRR